MNRRSFLKGLGLGGGVSALSACGVDDNLYYTPIEQVIPYVTHPEQVTRGRTRCSRPPSAPARAPGR
ncbi:MAG: twin-arginine translocation signal domain-containing protein [Myxococcota bacterium]